MKFKHLLLLALLIVLFFIEFPQIFASRSLDRISDFAHIIIFAAMTIIALKHLPWLKKLSWIRQLWSVLIVTVLIGLVIESLQFFSHRTPDIDDILRNILGASIGFVYWHRKPLREHGSFRIILPALLFCVLFEFYFVIRAVADDVRAEMEFPVLADFESTFEIDRWEGRADFEIVNEMAGNGQHSLKARFINNTFSDLSLIHFPGDWQGYHSLRFNVYNTQSDTATIFIRIYDIDYHEDNIKEKDDRYNDHFVMSPGWNTITIPLSDILNGPKSRKMDLSHLTRIRLFTQFLPEDKLVYFDFFRLD